MGAERNCFSISEQLAKIVRLLRFNLFNLSSTFQMSSMRRESSRKEKGLIVNPRGTSGSGKTEFVRRLMAEYGWKPGGVRRRL